MFRNKNQLVVPLFSERGVPGPTLRPETPPKPPPITFLRIFIDFGRVIFTDSKEKKKRWRYDWDGGDLYVKTFAQEWEEAALVQAPVEGEPETSPWALCSVFSGYACVDFQKHTSLRGRKQKEFIFSRRRP